MWQEFLEKKTIIQYMYSTHTHIDKMFTLGMGNEI